jgi:hypothetical protein
VRYQRASAIDGERLFRESMLPVCAPSLRRIKDAPLKVPADLQHHMLLQIENLFGSGMSMSPAVQCAMGNEAVRTLVLFPGVLGADEEDHLLARPDLPLLLVAAAEDDRGAATQRAYAARFSGPPQNHLELQRVAPDEPADWRGTDGLLRDTGLADALLWFLESHFPASGSAGS